MEKDKNSVSNFREMQSNQWIPVDNNYPISDPMRLNPMIDACEVEPWVPPQFQYDSWTSSVFENHAAPSTPLLAYQSVANDHDNNNNAMLHTEFYPLESHSGDEILQPYPHIALPETMMMLPGPEPDPAPVPNGGAKTNKKRKDARRWSPEEHKLLLLGIKRYNKGDWRSISRYMVITRSPTQVASHAQKYYNRQKLQVDKSKRKRLSIHDVELEDDTIDDDEVKKLHLVITAQHHEYGALQDANMNLDRE